MNAITKLAIYAAFFASGLIVVASTASAAEFVWLTVGAGCVPTGQTSQSNLHFQTAGRTKFNTGRIDEIILTCPITLIIPGSSHRIYLSYKDLDGTNDGSRVVATLRGVKADSGAVTSIISVDSNSSPETEFTQIMSDKADGGLFATSYYYVQISMTRTSELRAVEFGGVGLQSCGPGPNC